MLCNSTDDCHRIEAQIQLLDLELRPQLLHGGLEELPTSQAFEWIGGRFSTTDLQQMDWSVLGPQIQNHSHDETTLRLLTTRAEAGPAGALVQTGSRHAELQTLLQKEQLWLAAQTQPHHYFEAEGWRGSQDSWLETLNLPWGPDLAERWLAEGSPYRIAMGAIDPTDLALLRQQLEGIGRSGLRLPMRHELFIGQRNAPIEKA
jgi:putative ATPase